MNRRRKSNDQNQGEMTIRDFQDFCNKKGGLLDHYGVPANALQKIEVYQQRKTPIQEWLTDNSTSFHFEPPFSKVMEELR